MPPTRHSTSTAHKESDQIPSDQNYTLGDYSFRLERTSVPGSSNDKIEAICTKDGKNARKSIQVPSSTQISGWYVEANEITADVYVVLKIPEGGGKESDLNTGIPQPIILGGYISMTDMGGQRTLWESYSSSVCASYDDGRLRNVVAASSPFENMVAGQKGNTYTGSVTDLTATSAYSFTHNGKTVYYTAGTGLGYGGYDTSGINQGIPNMAHVAWTMVYGNSSGQEYTQEEKLVGRFAIDIEDAGGDGPESDWIDPGDYDPDWEEGDPTHTLYVEVTGALSGRHNDPIEDPSYSYIPSDKDTVKDYGCGGDGGHGGGGGAGASTVVIHKFATNQANSKEITAIARRHGYGSGGGKGGKGGNGCILVYY